MTYYLKIIRFPNLLIVAATQYLMRWFIIQPMLKVNEFSLQMTELNFFLLVLSTVCITAGGYVINDYFDTRSDNLNCPNEVIVGKAISRRVAMFLHTFLNATGILTGIYVSFKTGKPLFSILFIFVSGFLWFYSTTYKRQFLLGNLIVASLAALVPFIVALFEIPLLNQAYRETLVLFKTDFNYILAWVGGFSIFAFLTNLIREIIKDMEDYEGDSAYGCNTLPIVLGVKNSKLIICSLIVATISLMAGVYFKYLSINPSGEKDYIVFFYILIFLIAPLVYLIWKIYISKSKGDYHFASTLVKLIMIAGLCYAFVENFMLWRLYHVN
jgi:4-hydroxybenzoate polyprenyltransferase